GLHRALVRAPPALRDAYQRWRNQRHGGRSHTVHAGHGSPPRSRAVTSFDPQHDDLPDWDLDAIRPPGAIEPVPASSAPELRGRRVIVGLPGLGWRSDLRADETVVQGSRTYVP